MRATRVRAGDFPAIVQESLVAYHASLLMVAALVPEPPTRLRLKISALDSLLGVKPRSFWLFGATALQVKLAWAGSDGCFPNGRRAFDYRTGGTRPMTCENTAEFRFTWPGRDESFICEGHSERLRDIFHAMGLSLQLIPLPEGSPEQCRQQADGVSNTIYLEPEVLLEFERLRRRAQKRAAREEGES